MAAEFAFVAVDRNRIERLAEDGNKGALMVERVLHPKLGDIPVVGTPVKFSRMKAGVRRPAPLLGEHTDEILAEHGYTPEDIRAFRAKKVIV